MYIDEISILKLYLNDQTSTLKKLNVFIHSGCHETFKQKDGYLHWIVWYVSVNKKYSNQQLDHIICVYAIDSSSYMSNCLNQLI